MITSDLPVQSLFMLLALLVIFKASLGRELFITDDAFVNFCLTILRSGTTVLSLLIAGVAAQMELLPLLFCKFDFGAWLRRCIFGLGFGGVTRGFD
jgi:hypothetical protein